MVRRRQGADRRREPHPRCQRLGRRATRELFRDSLGPTADRPSCGPAPVRAATPIAPQASAVPPVNTPAFAPVVIASIAPSRPSIADRTSSDGVIEIGIGGSIVRVGKGVDAATLAAARCAQS